ncbi:SDR family oxidoreductase [Acidovorax sp. SUPP2522]|uniref:SDR family oxidoreductase n=1 Tax=unclassified Acidovorax TaxID=2684926 RepID=UPI0023492FF9|nr:MULTISPECIES: SDR family oxidoreductase [unclassified Acidovorax]WCM96710.1 SDR family oxidoreductase [Acidovorax sp. GBBC 1281]GKT19928.1 SDR family oxidoreductase [Acidovorax sp. SUPP2522]
MRRTPLHILVIGANGSIGRLVVAQALEQGHAVRALVRDLGRAADLPAEAERVVGDVTKPETLEAAVAGTDAIVFTHGSTSGSKAGSRQVDYGGVRNVMAALGRRQARVALMTAIGVTNRQGSYNQATEAHDWKRRSERLVRASGLPYTVVRPGWFDYNAADQLRLTPLQGDTRQAGNSSDGVVSRYQIAQVLVYCLTSESALHKTFELVAERGSATVDFEAMFRSLKADLPGSMDGVRDAPNMPMAQEPPHVLDDLVHASSR